MGMATTKKSKKTTGKSRKKVSGKVRNRGPIESFKEKVHDVVNRKPEEETIPQVDEGNIIELKETKDADGKIIYQAPDVNVPPLSEGDKNLDDPVKDQIFNTEPEDAGLVLVGEQGIIEVPEAITTMVSTKEPPAELSGDGLVQPGKDDLTNPDPDPNDPPKNYRVVDGEPDVTTPTSGDESSPGWFGRAKDWSKQKIIDYIDGTEAYYASKGGYTGPSPSEVASRKEAIDKKIEQRTIELNNDIPTKIKSLQNEINDLEDQRSLLTNRLRGRPADSYDIRMEISRIDRDIRNKRDEITQLQKRQQSIRTEIEKFEEEKIMLDSVNERYKAAIRKGKIIGAEEKRKERNALRAKRRGGGGGAGFKGGDLNSVLAGSKIDIGKNMNKVVGTGVGARGRPVTDVVGVKRGGVPLSSAMTPVKGQKMSVFDEEGALPKYGRMITPIVPVRGATVMPDVTGGPRRQSILDTLGNQFQKPHAVQQPVHQPVYNSDGTIAAQPVARTAKKGKKQSIDRKSVKKKKSGRIDPKNGVVKMGGITDLKRGTIKIPSGIDLKKGVVKNPTTDIRKTHEIITQNFKVPTIEAKGLTKFNGLKINVAKFDLKKKVKLH
jgi:hypothetical protein